MPKDGRIFPDRWRSLLLRLYGPDNPARIIRDFSEGERSLTHKAVRNWLTGETGPSAEHLIRAIELHGVGVLAELKPESVALQHLATRSKLSDLKSDVARLKAAVTALEQVAAMEGHDG